MYSLTICFGPTATSWAFLFKERKEAEDHASSFYLRETSSNPPKHDIVWITDDFGQAGFVNINSIHGVIIEDLDLTEQARIERSMVDARAQTKFNARAQDDPTIKAAIAKQQRGPSVITPMGR
jgi:hypothetical protein